MNFRFLFGIALVLACPARSMAASSGGLVVTMTSVADRVRARNPDLAAARLRIDEALGRMKQSGRRENPRVETELEQSTDSDEHNVRIGLMQKFPVTGRLHLEKEISGAELQAAEAELRDVERKLIAEARGMLVKILAIRGHRALLKEQSGVSGELAAFMAKAVERGEGSPLDAGQIRLESLRFITEARQLDAEEAAATGALKPLLGLQPADVLLPGGDLLPVVIPGAGASSSLRPDLQAARIGEQAAASAVELERAKKYDDIEAGVFGSTGRRRDEPGGLERESMIGFQFSIPLPWWNDNSGNVEAAMAIRERKRLETLALDRNIRGEAAAARAEMIEWAGLEREIRNDLLPLADKQAALAESSWRSGQAELQGVLRAREQRLQLASARLDALRDFHLARVRYEAALNRP